MIEFPIAQQQNFATSLQVAGTYGPSQACLVLKPQFHWCESLITIQLHPLEAGIVAHTFDKYGP